MSLLCWERPFKYFLCVYFPFEYLHWLVKAIYSFFEHILFDRKLKICLPVIFKPLLFWTLLNRSAFWRVFEMFRHPTPFTIAVQVKPAWLFQVFFRWFGFQVSLLHSWYVPVGHSPHMKWWCPEPNIQNHEHSTKLCGRHCTKMHSLFTAAQEEISVPILQMAFHSQRGLWDWHR